MSQRIKLENTHGVAHDRQTGKPSLDITIEYVCAGCRELVEQSDKYCWHCGELLIDTGLVEHHVGGGEVNDEQFQQMKAMPVKDTEAFLDGILPARTQDRREMRRQIKQQALDEANAAPHVRIGG